MSESLSAFAKRTGTATHDGCLLAADVLLNHPSAKSKGVVYQITLINGKRYIGSTRRPLVARIAEHISVALHPNRQQGHASLIYPALRKHGTGLIKVDVLDQHQSSDALFLAEGLLIAKLEPEYNIRVPCGVPGANSRYDAKSKADMLAAFVAGELLQTIAERFGCHPTVVSDHLGVLGVTKIERMVAGTKSRRTTTDEQAATILNLVRSGMTVSSAAVSAGVSYSSAKSIVRRTPVSTKAAANQALRVEFDVDLAVELWRAGSDLKAVGRVLGVSASTVNRYIRKAGVSAGEISTRRGLRCQA